MFEAILDAIIDSIKILPILFIVYMAIELIEIKGLNKLNINKLKDSAWAPLVGTAVGIVPQCGFSVVATDLYSKQKITVATLLAVYIATSDEAIPIILSNPTTIYTLLPLLLCKIILSLIVGYACFTLFKFIKLPEHQPKQEKILHKYCQVFGTVTVGSDAPCIKSNVVYHTNANNILNLDLHEHTGCCGHNMDDKSTQFDIVHPIIHTFKVFAYILVVNIVMSLIIYFVGMDNLAKALEHSYYFQPIIASLIGFIPNCASSIVLTELYVSGALSLGAVVAGLSVNAGIAFSVLIKQNKDMRANIAIIVSIVTISIIAGYIINWIV